MSTSILGRSAGTSSRTRSHRGYVKAMLAFLVLGAAFSFLSATTFSELRTQAGHASVQGQVIEVSEERTRTKKPRRIECSIVVSYAVAGESYRVGGLEAGRCGKRPGDAMEVRYNPSLPGLATVERRSDQSLHAWGGAAGAVLCGVVAPVILTVRAISRRKRRKA